MPIEKTVDAKTSAIANAMLSLTLVMNEATLTVTPSS